MTADPVLAREIGRLQDGAWVIKCRCRAGSFDNGVNILTQCMAVVTEQVGVVVLIHEGGSEWNFKNPSNRTTFGGSQCDIEIWLWIRWVVNIHGVLSWQWRFKQEESQGRESLVSW